MLSLVRGRAAAAARTAVAPRSAPLVAQLAARTSNAVAMNTARRAAGAAAARALASKAAAAQQSQHASKYEALAKDILKQAEASQGVALNEAAAAAANTHVTPAQQKLVNQVAKQGLIFELSLTWILGAYQHVFIGLIRNTFYTFRPIIILFVFGQILKMAFFAMGAPMLLSFYSIWMFEVFYGLLQCALSFIFISQYYNNVCFANRARPAMRRLQDQWMPKMKQLAARMGVKL